MHDFFIPLSQGYSLNIIVPAAGKIAGNATNCRKGGARGDLDVATPVGGPASAIADSGLKLLTQ
jgi:hypothetical protein